MMKTYSKPTMIVVTLQHQTHLLDMVSVTGNANLRNGGAGDGTAENGGEARVKDCNVWESEW